jgi:hypothetical protein
MTMKPFLIVITIIVCAFLGLRGIGYMASAAGRCELIHQPFILVGESPSFDTELSC